MSEGVRKHNSDWHIRHRPDEQHRVLIGQDPLGLVALGYRDIACVIVVKQRSDEAKEKLQECYDREWFKTAPMYIVGMKNVNENWVRRYDEKPHGDIDVAIAAEHLCLDATERGLGTCWVCNYDTDKMQQFFPREGFEAVVIIPLGHIAEDCPHTEKKRKEMNEIVEEI